MKRAVLVLPCIGVLALMLAAWTAPREATARSTTTERYYLKEQWHAIGDPRGGPAAVYVFQSSLTTTAGTRVGSADGFAVNLHRPMVDWNATAQLPGGTLVVEGAYALTGTARRLVVAGGSGVYAGARGVVRLTDAGSRGDLVTVTLER